MSEKEDDYPSDNPNASVLGLAICMLGLVAAHGVYLGLTAPFWLPGLVLDHIRHALHPKTPIKYRGTVRPIVPINQPNDPPNA